MPANADEIALGVIVALPAEAAGLATALLDKVVVVVAGLGRKRARDAATRLLECGARSLLSWGVAGGLSPQLRGGDLLLPRNIVSGNGEWSTHDGWRARLLRMLPEAREIGTLYCSGEPVFSLEDKRALAARGFDAVDMESAGVAQAAARAGVPFMALKAVCDPASRAVPALAFRALDADGRMRASAAFDIARAGPRMWWNLLALRRDFAVARAGLRSTVQKLAPPAEAIAS